MAAFAASEIQVQNSDIFNSISKLSTSYYYPTALYLAVLEIALGTMILKTFLRI